MAIGFNPTLRGSRLDAITTFAGNGALLRIYAGTQPSQGGAPTTLLATLTCGTPFASAATTTSSPPPQLTLNSITTANAAAGGTASWFRIYKADATTVVMDGTCGQGSGDLSLVNNVLVSGQPVQVTSFVITEANAGI